MATGSKKKLILSFVSLATALSLLIAACFAWFSPSGYNKTFTVTGGNIDLVCAAYLGNDADKDGNLESADGTGGGTRSQNLMAYYSPLDKNNLTVHGNFIQGNCLVFKLVILNGGKAGGTVSVALADLQQYVFGAAHQFAQNGELTTGGNTAALFDNNAGRTVFDMADIAVSVYGGEESDTVTRGYDTLLRTSDASRQGGGVTAVEGVATSYRLWEISDRQKFVSGIALAAGELLELDFRLYYRQVDQELTTGYLSYCKKHLTDKINTLLTGYGGQADADAYLDKFVQAEIDYLLGIGYENEDARLNGFTIEHIYIEGWQTA